MRNMSGIMSILHNEKILNLDSDSNLQISSLVLCHLRYPGSIDGTRIQLNSKAFWSVTL